MPPNFVCSKCGGSGFSRLDALHSHIVLAHYSHHTATYKCLKCTARFPTEFCMLTHFMKKFSFMKKHQDEKRNSDAQKEIPIRADIYQCLNESINMSFAKCSEQASKQSNLTANPPHPNGTGKSFGPSKCYCSSTAKCEPGNEHGSKTSSTDADSLKEPVIKGELSWVEPQTSSGNQASPKFVCSMCGESGFPRLDDLHSHIVLVHYNSPLATYGCLNSSCPALFATEFCMLRHVRSKHKPRNLYSPEEKVISLRMLIYQCLDKSVNLSFAKCTEQVSSTRLSQCCVFPLTSSDLTADSPESNGTNEFFEPSNILAIKSVPCVDLDERTSNIDADPQKEPVVKEEPSWLEEMANDLEMPGPSVQSIAPQIPMVERRSYHLEIGNPNKKLVQPQTSSNVPIVKDELDECFITPNTNIPMLQICKTENSTAMSPNANPETQVIPRPFDHDYCEIPWQNDRIKLPDQGRRHSNPGCKTMGTQCYFEFPKSEAPAYQQPRNKLCEQSDEILRRVVEYFETNECFNSGKRESATSIVSKIVGMSQMTIVHANGRAKAKQTLSPVLPLCCQKTEGPEDLYKLPGTVNEEMAEFVVNIVKEDPLKTGDQIRSEVQKKFNQSISRMTTYKILKRFNAKKRKIDSINLSQSEPS
ncbi:hypothetical protein Ddc_18208 [Ditylenchus destructor]|nr:hypothetical protein Ddc_18208 [Ditylenchus destructor]